MLTDLLLASLTLFIIFSVLGRPNIGLPSPENTLLFSLKVSSLLGLKLIRSPPSVAPPILYPIPILESISSCSLLIESDSSEKLSRILNLNIRSEEHTSELQSRFDLVCRLLLEKKNNIK